MPPSFRRSLPIAGVAALVTAAQALAETPAGASPHVRAEAAGTRALVAALVERSVTARTLVDRLNSSDVVVYIRHRAFTGTTLDGRIGIVRSSGPFRYLIVELACDRTTVDQLVALGHELQHAVEIANAVQVVDAPTLAAHYMRIGTQTNTGSPVLTFETDAARETSTRVRRELVGAWRTAHEPQ
jgi:hypothetical protein